MALGKHVMLLVCHLLLLLLKADSKCPKSYPCRNFSLEFPFTVSSYPHCGLFLVDGCDSAEEHPTLNTSPYQIVEKKSTNAFLVRRDRALQESLTTALCYNPYLPHSPFVSFTFSPNITFFRCYNRTSSPKIQNYFQSYRSSRCDISTVYYKTPSAHQYHHAPDIPQDCVLSRLPIKSSNSSADLLHLLTADFTLEWNVSQICTQCYHEGGQCLSDTEQKLHCSKRGISAANEGTQCYHALDIP